MSSPLLVARGLQKAYRMGREPLRVLAGCNLEVRPGEFVAIMGRSGSGKSTLLHILGALDTPDVGEIRFQGRPFHTARDGRESWAARADAVLRGVQRLLLIALAILVVAGFLVYIVLPLGGLLAQGLLAARPALLHYHLLASTWTAGGLGIALVLIVTVLLVRLLLTHAVERRRIGLRRHNFGFVFQFYHLLPELNVLENVLLPRMVGLGTLGWLSAGGARADARSLLERVGLGARLKHLPGELSGGERQRVAIARALVHRPTILFADEPTGNLDAAAGAELLKLLKQLHAEGQTIVMVTHDPAVAQQADRVLRLEGGGLRDG
jgi:ABC-type lipoprotein export system ATPase subunit